jgi:hypothetical protein
MLHQTALRAQNNRLTKSLTHSLTASLPHNKLHPKDLPAKPSSHFHQNLFAPFRFGHSLS